MPLDEFKAFVAKVRSTASLRAVIEEDTQFDASGFACCPLHKEKTPSFHLRDDDRFHCFGCGVDGDVFAYVIARDRCSFREAVDKVAQRVGLAWERGETILDDPEMREELAKLWDRALVQEVHDRAAHFMAHAMPSRVRQWVREKYGFTDGLIAERKIGWGNQTLYDYLTEDLEYTDDQLLKTGLFVKVSSGVACFFEDRVVFPYYQGGHARYFIGRQTPWTDSEQPYERGKYKKLLTHNEKHPYVSPCVENHWFYNEDDSRGSLKLLAITEGITDAISLSMVGVRNISPVTTRFSTKELARAAELCRNIDKVVICNDADVLDDGRRPGLEGAIATATYLLGQGIHAYIAELPRAEDQRKLDLNEFIMTAVAEGGLECAKRKVDAVFAKARPFIEWSIDDVPTNLPANELNAKLDGLCEWISKRPPFERASHAQRISRRFKITKATVTRQIENLVRTDEREAAAEEEERDQDQRRRRNREDERIRGRVYEDVGFYYTVSRDDTMEIISSFSIRAKRLIRYENNRYLIDATLRTENGTEFEHVFAHRAWSSRRDFIRDLQHPALQWTGSDDNVQGVLRLLETENLEQHQGTTNLGFFASEHGPRWVTRDAVFGPDGAMDHGEITYVDSGAPMADRLRYDFLDDEAERRIASEALPALMQINAPQVVVPCLGWFIASIVKPLIEEEVGHFPILFVNGTQGSGKTTMLRDAFWPLLGVVRPRDPFSVTDTQFAMVRNLSCTDSIPVYFDEYKPGDMNAQQLDRVHRFIRRVYGGETEIRGRSDQSVEKYRLAAPMVIAGESRPNEDPAILERILSVTPAKTELTSARQAAFVALTRSEHWRLGASLIRFVMGRDFQFYWRKSRSLTDEMLERIERAGNVPLRFFDNLHCMVFGLIVFEAYAEHLGVELPDVDYVATFREVVSSVLEGEDGAVKDGFDSFLESISTYAHLGLLEAGKHYDVDGDLLYIHLSACHQVYLTERKRSGQSDDSNGLRALRQILREKMSHGDASYVLDAATRHYFGMTEARCIEIDMGRIPETIDFTRMKPKKESRRYTEENVENDWTN